MNCAAFSDKLLVVLLGGPGCGKGTQAELLNGSLGLEHLSSGEFFRRIESARDSLSELVRQKLAAGDLIPDGLTVKLITAEIERMYQHSSGVVIDGFPRTPTQAQYFDEWLGRRQSRIVAVIHLKVDNASKISRMIARGRPDDTREIINHRLAIYDAATRPVFDHYVEQQVLFDIDGDRDVAAVHSDVLTLIADRLDSFRVRLAGSESAAGSLQSAN